MTSPDLLVQLTTLESQISQSNEKTVASPDILQQLTTLENQIASENEDPRTPPEILFQLNCLETQLEQTNEKVRMREHVIQQLSEEIKAKEQLIFEQGHLIHILETESRFDAESLNSESEITIIEKHCTSSSPCHSEANSQENCDRLREKLEQAMVDREKLELQNEQLLRQWEEALEYVTKVQRLLQEEIARNAQLKSEHFELERRQADSIIIPRNLVHIGAVLLSVLLYLLYPFL